MIDAACEVMHNSQRAAMRDANIVGIPLRSRDKRLVAVALIDAADNAGFGVMKWYLTANGYAANQFGYLHRQIMGATEGHEVDHMNGDKLDARRANLRLVSRRMNAQNIQSRGVSRHRGVSLLPTGRWRAYASQNGQQVNLGTYEDEDEAGVVAAVWRTENMPGTIENRLADFTDGWSRVAAALPWADVPEANKETMRAAVGALINHLNGESPTDR